MLLVLYLHLLFLKASVLIYEIYLGTSKYEIHD